MSVADSIRLLLLSIIWGASFLLMRIAAPEFGPVALILVRSAIAALCFAGIFRLAENRRILRQHLGVFFLLGIVNTALPFSLLAYSTLSLEAGFTSLLNATTPLFAAIIGTIFFFSSPLRRMQVVGLIIAFGGVAILSWDRLSFTAGGAGLAILAALFASMSYGFSVNFTKRHLAEVSPRIVAGGGLGMAGLILLVPGIWMWPEEMPSGKAWLCALLLACVCTAVAYSLFFDILKRTGAMATSSVTFLIPVFAILWGVVVLDEKVHSRLLVGMLVTLAGTALAVGLIRVRKRSTIGR